MLWLGERREGRVDRGMVALVGMSPRVQVVSRNKKEVRESRTRPPAPAIKASHPPNWMKFPIHVGGVLDFMVQRLRCMITCEGRRLSRGPVSDERLAKGPKNSLMILVGTV